MASVTILSDNGATSGSAGLKTSGGNDGVLILQTTTSGGTATNAIYVDNTQDVGIGTNAPAANTRLHVHESANTISRIRLTNSTTTAASGRGLGVFQNGLDTYFTNNEAGAMVLSTSGTERMRLDSSGNLGLGVTPSAWDASIFTTLQVRGSSFFAGVSSPSDAWVGSNLYYGSGAYRYVATGSASYYRQASGEHYWGRAGSGTAGNTISFTEVMRLDASGNLGLGTSSPSSYAGYATVTLNGSSGGEIDFKSGNTLVADIYAATAGMYIRSTLAQPMLFWTNGSERARIDSSGRFLIGTNSDLPAAGGSIFQASGSNGNWIAYIRNTLASGSLYGLYIQYSAQAPNNSGNELFYLGDSAGQRMSVKSNGGIYNYSANNSNLSDRREKTNFAPAKSYLPVVCAIPVQTFNYIDQNLEEDDGLTLGVVAQDVQAVAPELVHESNWGTKENPKMRLSIYQTDLQYALMKAIQELKAEVDALKGQA